MSPGGYEGILAYRGKRGRRSFPPASEYLRGSMDMVGCINPDGKLHVWCYHPGRSCHLQSRFAFVMTPVSYFRRRSTNPGIMAYGMPASSSSARMSVLFLHPKHPREMLGL